MRYLCLLCLSSADRFEVSLPFLTQQAAWLYERQLAQVRAQLRKVNRPLSTGTPPTSGSVSGSGTVGGHAMKRGGSGGMDSNSTKCTFIDSIPGSRVPSSLAHRPKERTTSHGEGSKEMPRPVRGMAYNILEEEILIALGTLSRTASNNTVTQVSASPLTPKERQSSFAHRRSVEVSPRQRQRSLERAASPSAIASDSSTSSSSESDAPHPMNRSRLFGRRPRYSSKAPLNPLSDADEEEEDSPPFLPFSNTRPVTPPPHTDPSATLKISPNRLSPNRPIPVPRENQAPPSKPKHPKLPQTAHSSSSSAQSQPQSQARSASNPLSALSPKQRRAAREGSDGTPSMGSSFSDLDDASVTQSALEEALANEMQHGGVASRMSTISQALRSRYL